MSVDLKADNIINDQILKVKKSLIIFLLIFSTLGIYTPVLDAQLSEDSEIYLVTCRPGDDIYNAFGHTAIRVYDPKYSMNLMYNFGIFSFDEPNFLLKFLRGKLMYWLGLERYKPFLDNYSNEERSVIEQKLNLDLNQRNLLFLKLKNNLKPENREYLYDFFFDNCSTRPRDVILGDLHQLELDSTQYTDYTFRKLLDQFTRGRVWYDFGIDLIIGCIADKKAGINEQMFLPEYLMFHIQNASIADKPLVLDKKLVLDYEHKIEKRNQSAFPGPVFIFAMILMLELILFLTRKKIKNPFIRIYDNLVFTITGIASIIIMFMWFGTDHIATKCNMNLLWINPLFLLNVFYKSRKLNIILLTFCSIAILQSAFFQTLHPASLMICLVLILKILRNTTSIDKAIETA